MKKNVMIIGAGGVAHVAAHKAAMNSDVPLIKIIDAIFKQTNDDFLYFSIL